MQGFVIILMIAILTTTVVMYLVPWVMAQLKSTLKGFTIGSSVLLFSSLLYWVLKPSVQRYFVVRSPRIAEAYVKFVTSAAFWPLFILATVLACLSTIEGIKNRQVVMAWLQQQITTIGNRWTSLLSRRNIAPRFLREIIDHIMEIRNTQTQLSRKPHV